ncbi:TonB-dependent receptor [Lewinella sp. 4G2]|uniref:TonB-dependent receptor n=1 Tax=Lewinella sp. 4G2 TaxID=1803372 RepID=UPI0007B4CA54|nr:TonB-dependent receptor [Lewinella sp. 4G2]OAV42701.1 hypothetical protein A3850_015790 [Lewinella sp. 4G2]
MTRFLLSAALALATICTLSGQKTITGRIIDFTDTPLIGANVILKGTDLGTAADLKGRFTLEVPKEQMGGSIIVKYLGFKDQEVAVANFIDDVELTLQASDNVIVCFVSRDVVEVTATAATSRTPVTYTNLYKADIQERNVGQDAPYLLKWTPSVVVNSDAGTGIGYTGIWIRGSDPTRTNITINGIPYNDSESQGVFWVNLPDFSSSADQIQIQRGVGTSVNGAGAFGASINFNTNSLGEEQKLSVDGTVGSFGTQRGSVQYSSGLMDNGLSIDARYSKTHSDGYVDRAQADLDGYYAGITYVANQGAGAGAGSDGAVWRFNAFGGHEVTYQSWNGVTEDEIAEFGRTYNSVGTEKEGEPYDNEVDNYRQNHYQLHYNNTIGNQWRVGISGHYTRGLGYFEQYKADEDLVDYGITSQTAADPETATSDLIRRRWLDNHFYGTVYSLRYRANSALDVTFGGSANEYLGDHYGEVIWARDAGDSEIRDRYYDNDAVKRDFSNYLRANYGFGGGFNAYADLQLRAVSYEFLGFANDLSRIDEDENFTFFNPKVGLLYDYVGGQAYASFGVAQREPNRNDFTENPTATRPTPEKLLNTEVGIRGVSNRFNYGANVYYMDYQDQLVLTGELNDVGEYIRANVDESYRLGIELQGGYQLGDFNVGGNLTVSRNRIQNFTEFVDNFDEGGQFEIEQGDNPLAFSPSVTGALDLEYNVLNTQKNKLSAALQTKYVGDRYVDNSGDENSKLDGYYYTDLRLSYRFMPANSPLGALRVTFLARNLTDQLYFSNGWSYRFYSDGEVGTAQGLYPQAGRNFLLGLGLDF